MDYLTFMEGKTAPKIRGELSIDDEVVEQSLAAKVRDEGVRLLEAFAEHMDNIHEQANRKSLFKQLVHFPFFKGEASAIFKGRGGGTAWSMVKHSHFTEGIADLALGNQVILVLDRNRSTQHDEQVAA
jgi:hypothetical protein